ncbi:MAG: hypothetical protein ACMG6E_06090 [Candidatus Roizmanbacteria bacterium]
MVLSCRLSLTFEWVQAVSVQTLVLALVHVSERGARGEVEVLANDEFLVDPQVGHDVRGLHLLDDHALLYEQSVLFLVLYCVHGKDLIIELTHMLLVYSYTLPLRICTFQQRVYRIA